MPLPKLSRRQWSKLLPLLATLPASAQNPPATTPGAPLNPEQRQPGRNDVPQRVTKEQLRAALAVIGLEFKDEEIGMALPGVNRQYANYQAIRAIEIPLDTPPAIYFSTTLPGHPVPSGASKFKQAAPAISNASLKPEDQAFSTALAGCGKTGDFGKICNPHYAEFNRNGVQAAYHTSKCL